MRYKIIVLEGIDGCGKTTQAKMLEEYLISKNIPCALFREPGGLQASEEIRSILLHSDFKLDPITELLLFSASRRELVTKKIIPFLETGGIVILDRFISSTVTYQGYGRGIPLDAIDAINEIVLDSIHPYPMMEIFIKVPVEVAMNRFSSNPDRIESEGSEFFSKISEGYTDLFDEDPHCNILDGCCSIDELHKKILNLVNL